MSVDGKGVSSSMQERIAEENRRRADRYPEAIRLMTKALPFFGDWFGYERVRAEFDAFLAEEPKP